MDLNINSDPDLGFRFLSSSSSPSVDGIPEPRKKRTKLIKFDGSPSCSSACNPKKPDPVARKITRPCTECGKKFWSWKALFGHMRCHPEREWRGINPPPNHRCPRKMDVEAVMT